MPCFVYRKKSSLAEKVNDYCTSTLACLFLLSVAIYTHVFFSLADASLLQGSLTASPIGLRDVQRVLVIMAMVAKCSEAEDN